MKLYIEGTAQELSKEDIFAPISLIFTRKDNLGDNDPSKDCILLEGGLCTCSRSEKDNSFSANWKGVEMTTDTEYGEDFSLDQLCDFLKDGFVLSGMDAHVEQDNVKITVEDILVEDSEKSVYLHRDLQVPVGEIQFHRF